LLAEYEFTLDGVDGVEANHVEAQREEGTKCLRSQTRIEIGVTSKKQQAWYNKHSVLPSMV
jgi:hypothetical protein